jgi:hypothetical protein
VSITLGVTLTLTLQLFGVWGLRLAEVEVKVIVAVLSVVQG